MLAAPTLKRRLVWLVGCIAAGMAIGLVARALGGSSAWFLAVPACLALGWLVLADPTQCTPPRQQPGHGHSCDDSRGLPKPESESR